MQVSIFKKMALLMVPTIIMGATVSTLSWHGLKDGTGELENSEELSQTALLSQLHVAEMSDAMKGYLLNPSDTAEAERKKTADDKNAESIAKMKKLTSDADFLAKIDELGKFDDAKLNPAEEKVMNLVKEGKHQEAQQVFNREYAPLRADYNKLSAALTEHAFKLSEGGIKTVETDMRSALNIILLSVGFGILIIMAFIFILARHISSHLQKTADLLSNSGEEFQSSSKALAVAGQNASSGSTQAAASLQETVASIEELSSMVKNNSESARMAAELSQHSAQSATNGQAEIKALSESISQISHASKKISEITDVIDDLAFQTNLLALNAAVEAARAGEQGKGFSVVADAVRSLAQKSATAAKDISVLIQDSGNKTNVGVEIAGRSAKALDEIVGSIRKVANLNGEISTASSEQANGIAQISKAMQELDSATQHNAAAADQVAAEADGIAHQAQNVRGLVKDLRGFINGQSSSVAEELQPEIKKAA